MAVFQQLAGIGPEGPRRAGKLHIVRDHIMRAASLENRHADHRGIHWRHTPSDNGLQRLDNGRAAGDRINAGMRLGRVAAAPADGHGEFIGIGHTDPAMDAGMPLVHRRPVMHSPDGPHVEFAEQPVLDHRQATAAAFFGRLEDEIDRAVEIPGFGKILRRTKKHRRVPVMAAGMHASRNLRGMREFVQFLHRQRVYIGAKPDGICAVPAAAQHTDNPGLAHAAMDLDTKALKLRGDEIRGPDLFKTDFRILVKLMAPGTDLVSAVGNGIDHSHGGRNGPVVVGSNPIVGRLPAKLKPSRQTSCQPPACGVLQGAVSFAACLNSAMQHCPWTLIMGLSDSLSGGTNRWSASGQALAPLRFRLCGR